LSRLDIKNVGNYNYHHYTRLNAQTTLLNMCEPISITLQPAADLTQICVITRVKNKHYAL